MRPDIIKQQLWIPKGFAHGFLVLSDSVLLQVKYLLPIIITVPLSTLIQ
ncbi:dTDP-4-dehydrorhamnose 3,5-epimerase [Escherichia coli]|nr:dTDP-4-dehydrorhamnose 3,5-epimerase [Escherichia coli]